MAIHVNYCWLKPEPHQPNRRRIVGIGPFAVGVAYDDANGPLAADNLVEGDPKNPDAWVRVNDFTAWGFQGITVHPEPLVVVKCETEADFTKAGPDHCPFCGSFNIEGESVDLDDDDMTQNCACILCSGEWCAVFKLAGLRVVKQGQPTVQCHVCRALNLASDANCGDCEANLKGSEQPGNGDDDA